MRRFSAVLSALVLSALTACAQPDVTIITPGPPVPARTAAMPEVVQSTVLPLAQPEGDLTAVAFYGPDQVWVALGGVLLFSPNAGEGWTELTRIERPISQLDFVSPQQGWAVAGGSLLATVDGGKSWTPVSTGQAGQVSRVDFADGAHGWVRGERGLYATRNGGESWTAIRQPCPAGDPAAQPFSLISPSTGWIACGGEPGAGQQLKQLYATSDGGRTWSLTAYTVLGDTPGTLPGAGYVTDLFFLDSAHGWLSTNRGGLLRTADGGRNWSQIPVMPEAGEFMTSVRFAATDQGYLLSAAGQRVLLATRDGGQTWSQLYPPPQHQARMPLQAVSARVAFAAGTPTEPGAILRSEDGGKTWQQVGAIPGEQILALSFPDARAGWALTERWDGVSLIRSLYRTVDGGASWTLAVAGPADPREAFAQISFVDAATGFVTTGGGSLLVTRDGGERFATVEHNGARGISHQFVTPTVGWKIADHKLYATADAGRSWTQLPFPYRVWQADLLPGGWAWLVAHSCSGDECTPVLISTADWGTTWTRYDLGGVKPLAVEFGDYEHGWMTDDTGRLYITEDAGITWTQVK